MVGASTGSTCGVTVVVSVGGGDGEVFFEQEEIMVAGKNIIAEKTTLLIAFSIIKKFSHWMFALIKLLQAGEPARNFLMPKMTACLTHETSPLVIAMNIF